MGCVQCRASRRRPTAAGGQSVRHARRRFRSNGRCRQAVVGGGRHNGAHTAVLVGNGICQVGRYGHKYTQSRAQRQIGNAGFRIGLCRDVSCIIPIYANPARKMASARHFAALLFFLQAERGMGRAGALPDGDRERYFWTQRRRRIKNTRFFFADKKLCSTFASSLRQIRGPPPKAGAFCCVQVYSGFGREGPYAVSCREYLRACMSQSLSCSLSSCGVSSVVSSAQNRRGGGARHRGSSGEGSGIMESSAVGPANMRKRCVLKQKSLSGN